jgi:hypothetical protein
MIIVNGMPDIFFMVKSNVSMFIKNEKNETSLCHELYLSETCKHIHVVSVVLVLIVDAIGGLLGLTIMAVE